MSCIWFNHFSYLNLLGTTLVVQKNLHLVAGIVSLIIKALGIVAVVQVALMEQHENISLGRSVETLLHCTIPFSEMQRKVQCCILLVLHFPASNYLSIYRRRLGFSWRFCAVCHDNSVAQAEWEGKRTWATGCED